MLGIYGNLYLYRWSRDSNTSHWHGVSAPSTYALLQVAAVIQLVDGQPSNPAVHRSAKGRFASLFCGLGTRPTGTTLQADAEFIRTREEPVAFFRLRALHLAPDMGLTTAFVDEHISVFVSAIGAEWLAEAATDVPPSIPIPFPRHPLGHIVATAGPEQIAEALEIGEYLRALYAVPNVGKVITGLKAQYYQTLLQLAFAARIDCAGAQELTLEPPAQEGQLSDILFQYEGRRYRAECFRPTYKSKGEIAQEIVRLATECLEVVRGREIIFSIAVDLTAAPTATTRRELVSVVQRATRQVVEDAFNNPEVFPTVLLRGPIAAVSVTRALGSPPGAGRIALRHREFPHQGDDWYYYARLVAGNPADMTGVRGEVEGTVARSSFALWLSPEFRPADQSQQDSDLSIERLGRKIERKLGQTRSTTGEHRILIVDAWQTRDLLPHSPERRERLRRKIVESHDGVVGLLMVKRDWFAESGRYGYHSIPLLRQGEPTLPERLVVALTDRGQPVLQPSPQAPVHTIRIPPVSAYDQTAARGTTKR